MSVALIRMNVSVDSELSVERDGVTTERRLGSRQGLDADLILMVGSDFRAVGPIEVSLKVAPRHLPDMNMAQAQDWLCDVLLSALHDYERTGPKTDH